MSENNDIKNTQQVDLTQLSNLQFSTAWTPSDTGKDSFADRKQGSFQRPRGNKGRDGFNRDSKKRSDFKRNSSDKKFDNTQSRKRPTNPKREGSDNKFRKPNKFANKNKPPAPYKLTMEVLFYPDDAPFNKLTDIMKASKRTYQLFDIAQLVLEKADRFVVLAKNLPDKEGKVKPLYCSQPQNIPFEDEQVAKEASIQYYIDELFTKETIEAEAPKGNFQVVNKCSVTGELIGTPNWHGYNEYIKEYHRQKCPKMSFDEFLATIESTRDQEQINAWLEQMKTRSVYKLKEVQEGQNDIFETRDALSAYIVHKMGSELVKTYEQVRMKGANLAEIPFGRIKRNITEAWKQQQKFPIVTANNLRGRLRRSGFAVYKRGSKGFAFVSVIKRKFLLEGEVLADMAQNIFNFISENAGIVAADLPYKFLGLTAPVVQQAQTPSVEETQEPAIAETSEISDEQKQKLSSVWSELLWLIAEGYVVEYADSTLQANPYLPRPKDKAGKDENAVIANDEPVLAPKEAKPEVVQQAEVVAQVEAEVVAQVVAEVVAQVATTEEISTETIEEITANIDEEIAETQEVVIETVETAEEDKNDSTEEKA